MVNHRKQKLGSARIDSLDCPEPISSQIAVAALNDVTRHNHPVVRTSVVDSAMSFVNPERLPQIMIDAIELSVYHVHRASWLWQIANTNGSN